MKYLMRSVYSIVAVGILSTMVGFDFSKHSIPIEEINDGGPPKDGIPALFDPQFIEAEEADYLKSSERILGVVINKEVKAYPIRILNWHEMVNDRVGGKDVLITYCPLCGTGIAFDAKVNGKRMLFGVSGKLYNSDVLFYDKETESLWSQLKMEAVTGTLTGQKLIPLPMVYTTWQDWKEKHPDTKVLSPKTGHFRDYERNPYEEYDKNQEILFPTSFKDKRLPAKTWVIGIIINGKTKAWPLVKLKNSPPLIQDVIGGQEIEIEFDFTNQTVEVKDKTGNLIVAIQSYWFAWSAFYPETELYE